MLDKAFSIAKYSKYDGYQSELASMVYKFFDKTTSCGAIKNENMSNKESAEKFDKPIFRKFLKRKVHSSFIDNISCTDPADMQLIKKFNQETHFLLFVVDIFSKCARVIPFKDKKNGITITNVFQKSLRLT